MKIGAPAIPARSKSVYQSAILAVLLCSSIALGQCDPNWKPGNGITGLCGGYYGGAGSALAIWDADGNGPQPELLVVGGNFTVAANVSANNIAAWDGNNWQPLGSGMNGYFVSALTIYNGELIAGGGFTTAGGADVNYIARWDGNSWHQLGRGIDWTVNAATVYKGELIVGGVFTKAGGINAKNIA
jgi:hypothetical protein